MNNLMLSFSGAELSRLRTLVTAVGKEIGLVPNAATTAEGPSPRTPLDMTWSHLVEMLDLGAAPEFRQCPECHRQCAVGATRCGHCWVAFPALKPKDELAA
jgi:hypothetical protein